MCSQILITHLLISSKVGLSLFQWVSMGGHHSSPTPCRNGKWSLKGLFAHTDSAVLWQLWTVGGSLCVRRQMCIHMSLVTALLLCLPFKCCGMMNGIRPNNCYVTKDHTQNFGLKKQNQNYKPWWQCSEIQRCREYVQLTCITGLVWDLWVRSSSCVVLVCSIWPEELFSFNTESLCNNECDFRPMLVFSREI